MLDLVVFRKMRKMLLMTLVIMTIFPVTINANSLNNSELELAKQAVNNYIEATQKGDVYEAIKWVSDSRFDSIDDQISQYKESINTDPFSNVSIEKIVKDSNSSFTVNLKMIRKENGEVNNVSLPVVNINGTWKLLIDGQETMSNAVRVKIQEERNIQEINKDLISPFAAVNLGNYEASLAKSGSTYSGKFDMTDIIVGITGWQYNPGTTTSRVVMYQIVNKGLFSDDVLGETSQSGYYPTTSDAFYITLKLSNTFTPPKGVYLKAKNPSDITGVFVKGYIYENQ